MKHKHKYTEKEIEVLDRFTNMKYKVKVLVCSCGEEIDKEVNFKGIHY